MARSIGIRIFKGDDLLDVLTFERDIIKIGRLASAHLRLEDPKVSRIHAVIDIAAGRDEVSIIDMGSAEGTKVNGEKISRVQLKHGDEVGLGDSRLVVLLEESEVAALGVDASEAPTENPANETEVIPGRGQLGSLPEPENRETDVFSGNESELGGAPVEGSAGEELTEAALAELRSSVGPNDTGVFEGDNSFATAPAPDDGDGAFAAGEGSGTQPPAPGPMMPGGVPVGSQPPMAVMAPLPPIPEDPVTPTNRFVEVELRWSGSVVDVKRVREQQSFSVGVLDSCDMFCPMEEVDGGAAFDLLIRMGDSGWMLNVTPKMGGTVLRNGNNQPLASAAGGGSLAIEDDMMVEIAVGYFTLVIRPVSRSKAIPIVPIFDMFMINTALVTLFSMVSVISGLLLAPVGLDDGEDDLLENSNQFQTILLKQPKKNEFLERFKEKAQKKSAAAAGAQSKAGKKTAKKTAQGKMAVKAPKKPTDAEVVAAKMKALGLSGESGGIAAIFGNTGGGELEAALGSISGNRVAAAYGSGGLGVRGAAPGGGGGVGIGTVGIGRVGTVGRGSGNAAYGDSTGNLGARSDRDVKISSGKPIILGSLDKEIIRRVVREHMAQIRYCYERELTKTAGIYGKIVMKWIINGQGKVTQAKVAQTQMKNANVERCIGSKIRTWRFPKPKGGGIVIVNYPFVFKQSN